MAGKTDAPVVQPVVAKTTVPAVAVTPVAAPRESKAPAATAAVRPAPSVAPPVPVAPEPVPAAPAVAATIERVRTSRQGASTVVTISGDGKLSPNGVTESRDLPRRLIIDFPNVASRAAAQTAGDGERVRKIRVGLNNNAPLVTRVVMEIADGAAYDVDAAIHRPTAS